jgi:hypothetical protein
MAGGAPGALVRRRKAVVALCVEKNPLPAAGHRGVGQPALRMRSMDRNRQSVPP